MAISVDTTPTASTSTELAIPDNRMNPVIKGMWLAALRDPSRKQAKHVLRSEAGECCLGVLCDVAVKNDVIPEPVYDQWRENFRFQDSTVDGPWESSVLPKAVREWAGIRVANPLVVASVTAYDVNAGENVTSVRRAALAELNDSASFTFAQLADLIEAQL